MSTGLIFYSIWLCIVSGCLGCAIGMAISLWRPRSVPQPAQITSSAWPKALPQAEPSPSREEIQTLLRSLLKINCNVDARVVQHSVQVEEFNETLENDSPNNREMLEEATKILVAANQLLLADLSTAKSELRNQQELVDSFKHESRTDALTELLNRRAFEVEMNDYFEKLGTDVKTFSLLFVDIDHFKRINDTHGHLNGDDVLLTVARRLMSSLPVPGSVARYGGEEFAVILPELSGKKAFEIAEHLRRSVESYPYRVDGKPLTVTISIGVSEVVHGDTRSDLIERSDRALFAAKNAGRNRCFYEQRKRPSLSSLHNLALSGATNRTSHNPTNA